MNIPIPVSPILKFAASPSTENSYKDSISSDTQESAPYVILLDSGTTVYKYYENTIQDSRDDTTPSKSPSNATSLEGIPQFLWHDYKITMNQKGELQKGYINYSPESGFQFIFRSNARSRNIDFSVPLLDFKKHWTTIQGDDRFFPGHYTVRSFLKSATTWKIHPHSTIYLQNILSPHVHPLSENTLIPPTLTVKYG